MQYVAPMGWDLPQGKIVGTPFWGSLGVHMGIIFGHAQSGEALVGSISSELGFAVQLISEFSSPNGLCSVEGSFPNDYPSDLPGWVVVGRAWSMRDVPYDSRNWNCEYLVNYAHEREPSSPQVTRAIVAGIVIAGITIVALTSR